MLSNKNLSTTFTVSPIGLTHNNPGGVVAPNNGADFGPDTPGTATSGLQEALNAIPNGGTIVDIGGGTYTITTSVRATGSNQVLLFNPSSAINLPTTGTSYDSGSGTTVNPGVMFPFTNNLVTSPGGITGYNYSHNRWIGNGIIIQANGNSALPPILSCSNVPYDTSGSGATLDGVVDGFDFSDVLATALQMGISNTSTFPTPWANRIRQVAIRNVNVVLGQASGSGTGIGAIQIDGGVTQVYFEDCSVDMTALGSSYSGFIGLLLRANWGDVRNVAFYRCWIGTNSTLTDFPLIIRGGDVSSSEATSVQYLLFQDCEFDTSSVSTIIVEDSVSPATVAFVNNIAFERCNFLPTGTSYQVQFVNVVSSNFGFVRFVDCNLNGLAWPYFANGNLTNRSPGYAVNISSVFTSSGYTYYNTDGIDELIVVDNTGAGMTISVDAVQIGDTSGAFFLRTGHFITLSWTTKPNIYKFSM